MKRIDRLFGIDPDSAEKRTGNYNSYRDGLIDAGKGAAIALAALAVDKLIAPFEPEEAPIIAGALLFTVGAIKTFVKAPTTYKMQGQRMDQIDQQRTLNGHESYFS
jgi:hypothetical protein